MFEPKPVAGKYVIPAQSQALMQGEELVALVFEARFAQLLSHSPRMLELIERAAEAACDFDAEGCHAEDCLACDAKLMLEELSDAPTVQ
jgi:hypothetical protein